MWPRLVSCGYVLLITLLLLMLLKVQLCDGASCNRRPIGAIGEPGSVDESFKVLIDGNPRTYVPGQRYLVTLSCASTQNFNGFTLVVENQDANNENSAAVGHFEVIEESETRFSRSCENMIESTNTNKKVRIEVAWIAPKDRNSGCILLKAAVVQHRNVWFIDEGFLTKQLCPEEIDDINSQTPILETCCACDEAKYEIIVERKWNRNTHPKDFPSEAWRTRFSEIIGASHAYDYEFWNYEKPASAGLTELGKHGSTLELEKEIKANMQSEENGGIRTLIKAPGVPYRLNSVVTTMAAVRVDRIHHLISFVSKILPSPDWIIGVARLELCLANCTWIDSKVLNLYPWDIGTDSGPSYMSPRSQQIPDVIRRITSTFPNDQRSPFFDDSVPMKPMATLTLTRKKIYEKQCEEAENGETSLECGTHPWNDWSECNVKCGPGSQSRVRSYKDPKLADRFRCAIQLSDERNCVGQQCGQSEADDDNADGNAEEEQREDSDNSGNIAKPECELTKWSDWSPCSNNCGKGWSVRTRTYVNPMVKEKCQSGVPMVLFNRQVCYGDQCGGTIAGVNDDDNDDDGDNDNAEQKFTRRPADNYRPQDRNRGRKQKPKIMTNDDDDDGDNDNAEQKFTRRPEPADNYRPQDRNRDKKPNRKFDKNDDDDGDDGENEQIKNRKYHRDDDVSYERETPKPRRKQPMVDRDNDDDSTRDSYADREENQRGSSRGRNRQYQASNSNQNDYCFVFPEASDRPCYLGTKNNKTVNYWFYDSIDEECKIFTTDYCDENMNKFRTLESCEETCRN